MTEPASATQRELGQLIGELKQINTRLDRADESRSRLHERVDDMADNVSAMAVSVESMRGQMTGVAADVAEMRPEVEMVRGVKAAVDEMKPEVDMVRNMKTKAGGAIVVLTAIGALLWFLLTTFADSIKTFFWPAH